MGDSVLHAVDVALASLGWTAVGSNPVKEGDVRIIFISNGDHITSLTFEILRAVNN
jgi:hypothetical protein